MNAVATAEAYAAPVAEIKVSSEHESGGLFTLRGRLGVLKYAAQSLVLYTAFFAAMMFVLFSMNGAVFLEGDVESLNFLSVGIVGVMAAVFIYLLVCMAVKRLHDINRSGWYLLLALVPLFGTIYSLYIMLKTGAAEENRFGAVVSTKSWEKVLGFVGIVAFTALGLYSIYEDLVGLAFISEMLKALL